MVIFHSYVSLAEGKPHAIKLQFGMPVHHLFPVKLGTCGVNIEHLGSPKPGIRGQVLFCTPKTGWLVSQTRNYRSVRCNVPRASRRKGQCFWNRRPDTEFVVEVCEASERRRCRCEPSGPRIKVSCTVHPGLIFTTWDISYIYTP